MGSPTSHSTRNELDHSLNDTRAIATYPNQNPPSSLYAGPERSKRAGVRNPQRSTPAQRLPCIPESKFVGHNEYPKRGIIGRCFLYTPMQDVSQNEI